MGKKEKGDDEEDDEDDEAKDKKRKKEKKEKKEGKENKEKKKDKGDEDTAKAKKGGDDDGDDLEFTDELIVESTKRLAKFVKEQETKGKLGKDKFFDEARMIQIQDARFNSPDGCWRHFGGLRTLLRDESEVDQAVPHGAEGALRRGHSVGTATSQTLRARPFLGGVQ